MPLPTPNDREKRSDFVSRCMSSETMKKDFKDNDQKLAVCYRQFKEAKDKSKASVEFGGEEFLVLASEKDYDDGNSQEERDYDHEMTISEKAMKDLHEKGETYITETDGDETMVIKVKYKSTL
jgi:hypothetical protein